MRIGLDIDDTITNTHEVLMKYAYKYNSESINRNGLIKYNTNNFAEAFKWTYEEMNDYFKTYYLTALDEILPKYGVAEVIKQLREEGHKIIFITIRNDKECSGSARELTVNWFNKYKIEYDELHTEISDKKEFCMNNNIEVFMDDSEKHCIAVNELGIKTFMERACYNLEYCGDIPVVDNMDEFLKLIRSIQTV